MQRNCLFNDKTSTTNSSSEDVAVLNERINTLTSSLNHLKNELFDVYYKEENEGRTLHPFLPIPGVEKLESRIETQEKHLATLKKMLKNEPVTADEQQALLKMDAFNTIVSRYNNVVHENNTPTPKS